jgi:hypothetical protein
MQWVKKLKGNPTSAISFQNEKNVVSKDGLLGLRRAQKGALELKNCTTPCDRSDAGLDTDPY